MSFLADPPVLSGDLVRLEPLSPAHQADRAVAAEEDRGSYAFTEVPRAGGVGAFLAAHAERTAAGRMVPFAQVRRADGRAGIYIESDDRKWYHATFMAPCENLPFTEHVGFRTTPPLPLDKFDSIEVRGENCYFNSMEKVPGLPSKAPKPAKP